MYFLMLYTGFKNEAVKSATFETIVWALKQL